MNGVLERAWDALKTHIGRENPLHSSELAVALGVGDEHRGTPQTRAIITELIRRGMPIGATEQGYFLLKDQLELDAYVRELTDRAGAIVYRGNLVKRAFDSYYATADNRVLVHWEPDGPEERV